MEELNLFIVIVDKVLENPLIMLFVFQWGLGWYLKNKTTLNNNIIPLILFAIGGSLGYFILPYMVINRVLIGLIVTFLQVGAFEGVKSISKLKG